MSMSLLSTFLENLLLSKAFFPPDHSMKDGKMQQGSDVNSGNPNVTNKDLKGLIAECEDVDFTMKTCSQGLEATTRKKIFPEKAQQNLYANVTTASALFSKKEFLLLGFHVYVLYRVHIVSQLAQYQYPFAATKRSYQIMPSFSHLLYFNGILVE